jgi:hypothetical protein
MRLFSWEASRRSSPSEPLQGIVSENGPREGTRDLPRPGPDAGRRAVEEDSLSGTAYASLARALRRRRTELAELAEAGGTFPSVAKAYQEGHPQEPVVTALEVELAIAEAKARVTRASTRKPKNRTGTP